MAEAKRKLAAILEADVAGYSRLMSDDEQATVDTLNAFRDIFRLHIGEHHGRVVDTAGDSVLAVFDSVVEAAQCAIDVQYELKSQNADLADDRRMLFRVGVNLGDIIEQDDGTVYGDGVNIAARLEAASEPGGITISGTAYDHIHNQVEIGYEDLGTLEVKNIPEPVRAYRLTMEGATFANEAEPALKLPDKPSIAVLPFENLSGDVEQEYFADGIAEDLITALSRIRWLFVIARNSSFTYRGKAVDVRQVGREIGVRYVLEGSVRKGGEKVRITAQLIDADTGAHVWARRYDRHMHDIFAVQDEITETIVAAIEPELGEVERDRAMRKPPEVLEAWDLYQRGMWYLYRFTAEDNQKARELFEQACARDVRFAASQAGLAYTHFLDYAMAYKSMDSEILDQASGAAMAALALDEKDALARCLLGRTYVLRGDHDVGISELLASIEINPSFALAHFGLAWAYMCAGRTREAAIEFDTAERLSPHDPYLWLLEANRGLCKILHRNYEAALVDLQSATRHETAGFWAVAHLACVLGHMGRVDDAKPVLRRLLELKPDFSIELYRPFHIQLENYRHIGDGLRKAGLDIPDEQAAAD